MNGLSRKVDLKPSQYKDAAIFISIAVFLAFFDLFTKYLTKLRLPEGISKSFVSGFVDFMTTYHIGSAMDQFYNNPRFNHNFSIIAISLVSLLCFYALSVKFTKPAKVAIMFIIAGGLGNLIDKLLYGQATNIMCTIEQQSHEYSLCFNVADLFVDIGLLIGTIYYFYFLFNNINMSKRCKTILTALICLVSPIVISRWLIFSF